MVIFIDEGANGMGGHEVTVKVSHAPHLPFTVALSTERDSASVGNQCGVGVWSAFWTETDGAHFPAPPRQLSPLPPETSS